MMLTRQNVHNTVNNRYFIASGFYFDTVKIFLDDAWGST